MLVELFDPPRNKIVTCPCNALSVSVKVVIVVRREVFPSCIALASAKITSVTPVSSSVSSSGAISGVR